MKTVFALAALSLCLPIYDCHKQVMAAEITGIAPASNDGKVELFLQPFAGDPTSLEVTTEWIGKHDPQLGGYFVAYADGYQSYSPKEAFEGGYSLVQTDNLKFGDALAFAVDGGHKIAREGWNGKGMFVYHVPANAYPAQTEAAKSHFGENALVPYGAYLALKGANDVVNTWVPSISDVLANDWRIAV